MMRHLTLASVLAAVVALGFAARLAVRDGTQAAQALAFRDPATDLGSRPHGLKFEVSLVVVNNSPNPWRILNLVPSCQGNCCFASKLDGQVTVPPHSEVTYVVEVTPAKPGPFGVDTVLYIDDHGLRAVPVVLRGTAE